MKLVCSAEALTFDESVWAEALVVVTVFLDPRDEHSLVLKVNVNDVCMLKISNFTDSQLSLHLAEELKFVTDKEQ
jgi:hypothetical protein